MSGKQLTREYVNELLTEMGLNLKAVDVIERFVNELEKDGFLSPEPEEPKELTALEACAVIARGGKVKDIRGHEYPDHNGSVNLIDDCKPFTEIKKTIEIDAEIWVNVYPNGKLFFHDANDDADRCSSGDRIACIPVRIKETVEVE
tara:strand:+ start:5926 stop:6363 length:438 start_codon:yes stop_codon:yes gene_type:complete